MTTVEHPNATVPDNVQVPRVGAVQYELGFPTAETSRKLFDEMDFQRAVQAYMWAYPAVSFESIRLTLKHDLGIDSTTSPAEPLFDGTWALPDVEPR